MNLALRSVRERLPIDVQVRLVDQARTVCAASPPVRPVARGGATMSVRVTSAGRYGWVGDGEYRYTEVDARGKPWPPLPAEWVAIANRVMGRPVPWDCAILNWYAPGASLGKHRDLGERDRSQPIVTISLGDAASWLVQADDGEPVHRTRLESGDVTVLCAEDGTRLAIHAIERVIESPLFRPPGMEPGRLSLTLRVVG